MREDAAIAVIVIVLIALPVGLLIGSVILRGGVSFANKSLPKPQPRRRYDEDDEDDDEYDEGWDAYDRPRERRAKNAGLIPEPGLGKGMGIVFVNWIAQSFLGGFMRVSIEAIDDEAVGMLLALIALPVWFCIAAGIRAGMLPTSFARASLVVLFEVLIVLAICVVVGVPLYILLVATR